MNKRSQRSAFTLVEILVVIGIIAILIGVILPSVSKSKGKAIAAKCASNVRQCVQALHLYANDNEGRFPKYYDISDPAQMSWSDYLRPYVANAKADTDTGTSRRGRRRDPQSIFNCPSVPYNKDSQLAPYGLDFASTLGYTFAVSATRWRYLRTRVPDASSIIMVGDMNITDDDRMSTADGFRITGSGSDIYTSFADGKVAGRHEDLANMAFVDAHVQAMSTNDLTKASENWIWYAVP